LKIQRPVVHAPTLTGKPARAAAQSAPRRPSQPQVDQLDQLVRAEQVRTPKDSED
jgi:hypothetical protein